VSGDKDGELLYMTPWSHLFVSKPKSNVHHLRKGKTIIEEEFEVENRSRFIVLASNQKSMTKMSPFMIIIGKNKRL
jgi:hypothetical protein